MNKKKILHIPNFYPPHTGGIEDVCYNIVRHFSMNENIEQRVICFSDMRETIYNTYQNVPIVRIGRIVKISSQSISLRYSRELKKIIRKFNPDVIGFHAPNPLVAYYLLKVLPKETKLILHWHSDIVSQKILYRLIKPIEERLLKRADVIAATSPNYIEGSEPLQKFREKTIVLQNIIDPQKFELTDKVRKQISDIKEIYREPIILFVGRHVPYKGLQYLLEAIPLLQPKCDILIGGTGPLSEELRATCKTSNVHFLGRISEDKLTAYYYAADIFAFPSITKNEAFGIVLAEAMFCHTPAITFTIPGSGVNWVNKNGETGIEVENSNAKQLADALDLLLSNKKLREQYASQARLRAEDFFISTKISKQLDNLYL